MSTDRVRAEWHNRVVAEYTSAAHTAQVLHAVIQCGLPDETHRVALRIVADELDHARLCHDCWVHFGGADQPAALDVSRLAIPIAPEGPLATLVDVIVSGFCLGETFAVPLFNAMRRDTGHPLAKKVLERVLQDEAIHRAFGWHTFDVLLEIDPEGVRDRARRRLPRYLEEFRQAYGVVLPGEPLTADERHCGLLAPHRYVEVYEETLHSTILPRFAQRGVVPQ